MHAIIADPGDDALLRDELERRFPRSGHDIPEPGWVTTDADLAAEAPILVFARQTLLEAIPTEAESVRAWSEAIAAAVLPALADERPWRLHIEPCYGTGRAGVHRASLIRAALLELLARRRRHLRRALAEEPAPFDAETSLVQAMLTAPERGWISVAPAPLPERLRAIVSPFPRGEVEVPRDPAPPSRAYAKLIEAELRLGRAIRAGETCVDLGAAPGSWTHVALARGARVIAVDRSPLREDLMAHPALEFVRGDAFRYAPDAPVDWLLCDVIAEPARSIDLLLEWAKERRMRRFIVTIKFRGQDGYAELDRALRELPAACAELRIQRLCANKNEVCAFGEVRDWLRPQPAGACPIPHDTPVGMPKSVRAREPRPPGTR